MVFFLDAVASPAPSAGSDTFTKISMWEDIVSQEDKAYFASIALSYFLQLERRKGLRGREEEELHSSPE